MSFNDSDKTVFKQPMPGGDRTSMRAASRERASPPPQRQQPLSETNRFPEEPPVMRRPAPAAADSVSFNYSQSVNPVVAATSTLIAVFCKTRSSARHSDIGSLHQRLIAELKLVDTKLADLNLRQEQMLSIRYLLCSALDEAVLNTPWGSESPWAQRTLLSVLHGETSGGEKSFLILDRVRQTPSENLEIIELFYIFISLGFEGRYRLIPRGREALDQLREELFSIIRRYRGDHEPALSPSWSGLGGLRNQLSEHIPLWVLIALMAGILFFSYTGLRYWLYSSASPVVEEINLLIPPLQNTFTEQR